jgi:chemotaxis signal transduction protein
MEKPPFLISENISADYIKAVARLEENLVIILNLAALPSFRMLG